MVRPLTSFQAPDVIVDVSGEIDLKVVAPMGPPGPPGPSGSAHLTAARVAATGNVDISSPGAAIDGVTLVTGNRVLLPAQSVATQNGVYTWTGAALEMSRASDLDESGDFKPGMLVVIEEGTANHDSIWQLETDGTITLGTTALTFRAKAGDVAVGEVVHKAGTETITGDKNFTGALTRNGNAVVDVTNSNLTGAAQKSANLSDLASAGTARTNLGLGNVNNTSDAAKPISTATQVALDGKQPLDADLAAIADLDSAQSGVVASDGGGWLRKTFADLKVVLGVTKSDVGLANVDNTSDAAKPISTATQSALDGKQPLDSDLTAIAGIDSSQVRALASDGSGWVAKTSAQFKTWLGLVKADVGLNNVDNTSDANKPVSSATQTALNGKADLVGGLVPEDQLPAFVDEVVEYANLAAFPGTGDGGKIYVALDTNKTYRWSGTQYVEIGSGLALGETSSTAYRGDRGKTAYDHTLLTNNPHSVTKSQVGLGNVDNTSDANKPVSTAQQTALDAKQPLDSDLTSIAGLTPTNDDVVQRKAGAWTNRSPAQLKIDLGLTKSDVGLANADNTSDANKPVSTAQQTALDAKVDKATYDANTIVKADLDNTPTALAVAPSAIVGRLATGGIAALTVTELRTLLGLLDEDIQDLIGAMVSGNTETNITVTYDDTTGKLNFVVGGVQSVDGRTGTVTLSDLYQALDGDLTTIAGLTPTNDDVLQRKAGAWVNRAPAQLKTDLALTKTDVGLPNAENTSDANKPVSTATQAALDAKAGLAEHETISGNWDFTGTLSKSGVAVETTAGSQAKATTAETNAKAYTDSVLANVALTKVRVASSGNVNTAAPGSAIDGVTLANNNRVLLRAQTTASENGIYIFQGASQAMIRASDLDASAEMKPGLLVVVEEGTANGDSVWELETNAPINLGSTALTFTAKAGSAAGIALDSAVVHKTGAETIADLKVFTTSPSVPTPTSGSGAAPKSYVDSVAVAGAPDASSSIKGIIQLEGDLAGTATAPVLTDAVKARLPRFVRVATTAALPTNTRSGNVLTASANGALPAQDSVSLSVGNSLLVKDETTKANNGIYTVTSLGSGSTPWVLTRHTDADTTAEVPTGLTVFVTEGKVNADQEYRLVTDSITLNTTALTFRRVGEQVGINLLDVAAARGEDIAGTGVDAGPALQQAFDICPWVYVPTDTPLYINTPIFLDRYTHRNGQYILTGGNNYNYVRLGPDLPGCGSFTPDPTVGWAFFVDQIRPVGAIPSNISMSDSTTPTGGGDLANPGRLILRNLIFNGEERNVGVAFGNDCSSWFENLHLIGLRVGQSWRKYADGARMVNILTYRTGAPEDAIADAWGLWQIANGDNIVIDNFKGQDVNAANLTYCQGASIVGCFGYVKLTQCRGIRIQAHFEAHEGNGYWINCSQVTFDNMYWTRPIEVTTPIIEIDDSNGESHSDVTFRNSSSYDLYPSWVGDTPRGFDLKLTNMSSPTRVRAINSVGGQLNSFDKHYIEDFRITATDSALSTKLNSTEGKWVLAQPDWQIFRRSGAWQIEPAGSHGFIPVRAAGTLTRGTTGAATDLGTGTLTNGQLYEYIAATRDINGNYSAPIAAWSVTATATRMTFAQFDHAGGPYVLCVWRKTGTGVATTPDRYVEIGIGGYKGRIVDSGAH